MSDPITTKGLHNPQHVNGEATVEVTQQYMSEDEGHRVGLTIEYPNGTVSTIRLSPEQAEDLAYRIGMEAKRQRGTAHTD